MTPPRIRAAIAGLRDIRARYGDDVAAIVDSCTDSYEDPKPAWRTRKEHYLEHLADSSPSALRVSIADKVDNASSILADLATHAGCGVRRRLLVLRQPGPRVQPPAAGPAGPTSSRGWRPSCRAAGRGRPPLPLRLRAPVGSTYSRRVIIGAPDERCAVGDAAAA